MNNNERELWIMNDEGLYNWYESTRLSITQFIKDNKDEIDEVIHDWFRRG